MSLPILGASLLYVPPSTVTPGSTTYSASGNYNFTVPAHNTLVVKVWGPGGSGGGTYYGGNNGSAGTDSKWDTTALVAHSGIGGGSPLYWSISGTGGGGSSGGTATGGTTNTTGASGVNGSLPPNHGGTGAGGAGGAGANGGASDTPPGGGGTGGSFVQLNYGGGGGGGGGGYCERSYTAGTYSMGQIVPLVVGTGGICTDSGTGFPAGNPGATGKVQISWS